MTTARTPWAPGPWMIGKMRYGYDHVILTASDDPVALVVVAGWDKRSAAAHATLIAAAPDMAAALAHLLDYFDGGIQPSEMAVAKARAALALARGE